MRGKGKLLVGPREALLCYRLSSITAARAGSSTHQVIFMPHSEKQNHCSVKAALLCFFYISDENKSTSVSFDVPHFLTDTFRMLTSILVWWVPIPQQSPKIPWGIASMQVQRTAEKQNKDGMCPQPPCFSLAVTLLQYKPQGAELLMLRYLACPALGVRRLLPTCSRYCRAKAALWSGGIAVLPPLTALPSCDSSSAPSLALC